jgi:hypothetical protein
VPGSRRLRHPYLVEQRHLRRANLVVDESVVGSVAKRWQPGLLVPATGIELVTYRLQGGCSTI